MPLAENKVALVIGASRGIGRCSAIGLAQADSSHLHSALEDLRAALLATPVPADVEDTIRQAYLRLGNEPLAVRSSAYLEDLAAASGLSRRTVQVHLQRLISLDLAARRNGRRQGASITPLGLRTLPTKR